VNEDGSAETRPSRAVSGRAMGALRAGRGRAAGGPRARCGRAPGAPLARWLVAGDAACPAAPRSFLRPTRGRV